MGKKQFEVTFKELDKLLFTSLTLQYNSIKNKQFTAIPYIQGSPGIGKSEYMKEAIKTIFPSFKIQGKELKFLSLENVTKMGASEWGSVIQYLATFPLEKMTGLPCKTNDDTIFAKWTCPDLFDFTSAQIKPINLDNSIIVLFLDDCHLVKSNMSPYLFQLFSYRSIHGYTLPDNVLIICAGNGPDDNAGYNKIPTPIINRHLFFYVYPEIDVWIERYAIKKNIRPEIISFLKHDESFFFTKPINEEPFCTPRSWVSLSNHMSSYYDLFPQEKDTDFIYQFATGLLSTEAVGRFSEYIELIYKWDAKSLLDGSKKLDSSQLDKINAYALLSGCSGVMIDIIKNMKNMKKNDIEFYVRNFKSILGVITKSYRTVVPIAIALVVRYEFKETGKMDFTKSLISDEVSNFVYELT
jgi:hypothetical protein